MEGMMPKVKLQYFGHLMRTADSLEKSLMLGKIKSAGAAAYPEEWCAGSAHIWCHGNGHPFPADGRYPCGNNRNPAVR